MRLLLFLLASSVTIINGQFDLTGCAEGFEFSEENDKCEEIIIKKVFEECGYLEVLDEKSNTCITDCGEKVYNTVTKLCEDVTEDARATGCVGVKKCSSGETQDDECRCVKKIENDCCIASVSDFDIRVTSNENCNCNLTCESYKNEGYKCVKNHLCDDYKIKTDGAGLITVYSAEDDPQEEQNKCKRNAGTIDLSDKTCPNNLVCCKNPADKFETIACPDEGDYSDCGRIAQNEQSINLIDSKNPGKKLNDYQAQLGEFPHMCLFYRSVQGQREFKGGASLISNKFLLTTAHKFYIKRGDGTTEDIRKDRRLAARCGELNVKKDEPNFPDPQESSIVKVLTHPEYNPNTLEHNIAIIQVGKPFTYQSHISPVCLPQPNTNFDGYEDCWSTGWGSDSLDSAVYSDLLKKVQLPIFKDRQECQQVINDLSRFKDNNKRFTVYDSWLCVGGLEDRDTCRGDGGSPHVCRIKRDGKEKWVQVGAVAFGFGCGQKGIPSIYSAVAPEMCWIDWVMSCSQDGESISNSVKEAVDIRQQQGSRAQVVDSLNKLKRRDCDNWLQNNPALISQCKVNYK